MQPARNTRGKHYGKNLGIKKTISRKKKQDQTGLEMSEMYPREMYPGELAGVMVSVNGVRVMRICCFDDMLGPLLVKMMI